MAGSLQEISTLLIQQISRQNINELANNKQIMKLIDELKALNVRLPLDFNIEHVANNHQFFYPLRNCDGIHCFECLLKSIQQGVLVCEHSMKLTRYEKHHIPLIDKKLRESV
jgi:hypothetical protein